VCKLLPVVSTSLKFCRNPEEAGNTPARKGRLTLLREYFKSGCYFKWPLRERWDLEGWIRKNSRTNP
jgi:hypothetical protein